MSNSNPYRIPIVDLRAQYDRIGGEIQTALTEVAQSQQFILGPVVRDFEAQMARYLGCAHAIGVASGSDALLLALMALEIGPGDAVMTTPFTFFSTVSSITRLGATPLFVDIEPESFLLSPVGVERLLAERNAGPRVKALLPVHLFGQASALEKFAALAKQFQLHIVEDAAQACGSRLTIAGKTQFAGAIGTIGCFSFFPSKNLGGFGDGGLVTTNDEQLADRIRMLRMHGEREKYLHQVTGINSRLDSLQAAVLAVKLKYLESWCEQRIDRARKYLELWQETDLVRDGLIVVPRLPADKSHVFNNYVIRARRRDELKQFLAQQGIQSEIYYPLPLHLQRCFATLGYKASDFPEAERAAREVLALPLYPELTNAQQEFVVEQVQRFYHR